MKTRQPEPTQVSAAVPPENAVRILRAIDLNRPSGAMVLLTCLDEINFVGWPKSTATLIELGLEPSIARSLDISGSQHERLLTTTLFIRALYLAAGVRHHDDAVALRFLKRAFAGKEAIRKKLQYTMGRLVRSAFPSIEDDGVLLKARHCLALRGTRRRIDIRRAA